MSGEKDLEKLMLSMSPVLKEEVFVFCTGVQEKISDFSINPVCRFVEDEGESYVITREEAEQAGIEYEYPCRMITLFIHSSLEAVGFLARITAAFAENGLSVNPVSAFYHDHIFVPEDKADASLDVLMNLSKAQG